MRLFLLTVIFSALFVGCSDSTKTEAASSKTIKDTGLIVLTRNAPTTYYIDRDDEAAGLEHDLAKDFADSLGVDVKFKFYDSLKEIQDALEAGEGHIAAAGLTRLASRTERFIAGPKYQEVEQQVICRRSGHQPKNIEDLENVSVLIASHSSYEDRLQHLKATQYPDLTWETSGELSTEQILEKVWHKEVHCTVADSNIFAINRRFFPELVQLFPLNEPEPLVWLMRKDNADLLEPLNEWFSKAKEESRVALYAARYYAHVRSFDYVDVATFIRRIKTRLPLYEPLFREAAERYQIDWHLLAAQAYQESHWNKNSRSPTGVRGLMMLTQPTAKELGVTNRLDPQQSIDGGARYLDNMRKRLPDSIDEPHRTWAALAAYNIGMGHIQDTRRLTKELGKNPDDWLDLITVLPKLSQPKYYKSLRYGYARGGEPVQYLARIRNYKEILIQQLAIEELHDILEEDEEE